MSFSRVPRLPCLLCQWRKFSTSYRRLAEEASKASKAAPKPVQRPGTLPTKKIIAESPLQNAPRSYGKRLKEFTPEPLPRPIGMSYPPELWQNTGIDLRTIQQRRDDFVNYDKHLVRRKELTEKFARPYFRDWSNMNLHGGKSFIAPPRLFKDNVSLYFPNLHGRTLSKTDKGLHDTTSTLMGTISVVSMFSSQWANDQVDTFVSAKANPELHKVLAENKDRCQLIRINVEHDWLKRWVLKLFLGGLRKRMGEENWDKYFIVPRSLSDEIRESCGLLNSKVGYVYLLDSNCRIRWAGSGVSEEHEREGLVKGVQRLLKEEEKSP